MKTVKILAALAVAAGLGACQTTGGYPGNFDAVAPLIGQGLGPIEIYTPPTNSFYRADNSYCEVYRFRRHVQYGTATVCLVNNGSQWMLAERIFDTPTGGMPVPYPPVTPYPPTQPVYPPAQPVQPNPVPPVGGPGQWSPVNF